MCQSDKETYVKAILIFNLAFKNYNNKNLYILKNYQEQRICKIKYINYLTYFKNKNE